VTSTTASEPLPPGQLTLDVRPPLAPRLDNFVVGRNAEALAAVAALGAGKGVGAGPEASTEAAAGAAFGAAAGAAAGAATGAAAAPRRLLYLWGEARSGRSHLLAALAAAGAWRWTPDAPPQAPGLALVDDADRLDATAQLALFSRLNAVLVAAPRDADLRCMVTGPVPPLQLALRADVRSRLGTGLVHRLHRLNDAEMAAALAARARARGATVGDDLVPWMLTHLPRDMGRLAAAIDALDGYALARRRPLNAALLREWLAAGQP
jgi:DnaA family protein